MKKGIILMISAMLIMALAGCMEKGSNGKGIFAKPNNSGMTAFIYSYDGTIGGNNYRIDYRKTPNGWLITYGSLMQDDYGQMTMEEDGTIAEKIMEAYLKHKAYRWAGYSKYNPNVSDGSGFTMEISFADGKDCRIHGMNARPSGYRDFEAEILPLFDDYIETLLEEGRQRKIAEGVNGDLTSVMLNFLQRGTSGSDRYEIFITRSDIRDNNVDIRIVSESGDFIEKGKYNYYCAISDEDIPFEEMRGIIEKYQIINWFDYDKSAEDYNNQEWFQISLGFESGDINALGTEHPENYEQFRQEMLELIVKLIKECEWKYPDFINSEK